MYFRKAFHHYIIASENIIIDDKGNARIIDLHVNDRQGLYYQTPPNSVSLAVANFAIGNNTCLLLKPKRKSFHVGTKQVIKEIKKNYIRCRIKKG